MANITYTITQDGDEISYTINDGVGPVGPAGPNNITTATETDITGILKGDGANVSAAVEDTDYQGVPAEGAFIDGDKTKLDGIEAGADVTDAANVDAAGAVMESDLQSDIQANPSAPLKGDGAGSINVSYLGLETYILGGPLVPSGTPSWNMPNVSGVLANATNNDGEVGANGIDFAGSTDIGADLADADEVLVSDGGGNTTRVKSALSRFWTYIKAKIESVGLSSLNITGNLTAANITADGTFKSEGTGTSESYFGAGNFSGGEGYHGIWLSAPATPITPSFTNYTILSSAGNTSINAKPGEEFRFKIGNTTQATLDTSGIDLASGKALSFAANSGTWSGSVFGGDQSFSGQVELTGQAASTDDSAMTRSLGDARYAVTLTSYKTANEDKANDTTRADDSELALSLEASSTYIFEIILPYWTLDGTNTQGIDFGVSVPTNASIEGHYDVAASGVFVYTGRRFTETTTRAVTSGNGSGEAQVRIKGTIKTSTTAGTFAPQWAQAASSANRTRVKSGAYMIAHKIQ